MRVALCALAALVLAAPGACALPARTDARIGVFSDQLPDGLSPGLLRFAATHYAGAQKLGASETKALKAIAPSFFMIQYRLALGLGVRTQIRFGDTWRREWPPRVQEQWLYHRNGARVFQSTWGWYLTNPDDVAWQRYYVAQLRQQVASTDADGAFLDSASIPNELGGSSFRPALPAYDPAFENVWRLKLQRWLPLVQARLGRPVIANAGSWITTRDRTDYSRIAGVMVEGFAPRTLAPVDWKLQLDRIASLVRRGRIVVCQAYPALDDVQARMFALGSYLLVKGSRTYVNMPQGIEVDWLPEYGIDLGAAAGGMTAHGALFVRRYAKGVVVVDPGDAAQTFDPGGTFDRITPVGGGAVPDSGELPASWRLDRTPVSSVALGPHEAAVLLAR